MKQNQICGTLKIKILIDVAAVSRDKNKNNFLPP
jgi:hypothetical protein